MTLFERALSAGTPAVRLYDEDSELFEHLDESGRQEARARAVARCAWLEPGPWSGSLPGQDPEGQLGLLVLDGILVRSIILADRPHSEIVGRGDLLRPWEHDGDTASIPFAARWQVLEPTRLAVLDERFLHCVCRWPSVVSAVVGRAIRRSRWLALQLAISDLRRVEDRLVLLFWHLADRWGRVRPDGIVLSLPVTHEVLAQLVGAQRPTVTAALAQLARDGRLVRRRDRTWLLSHEPPADPRVTDDRRQVALV